MNFYDTYVMYCSRVGKTPSGVAREIGISKSIVSRWKNGGGKPTDSTIQKIADYFGVSVSVMRGNENTEKTVTTESDGMDKGFVFYRNFVDLCNKKGMSPSAVAEEMGYQRSVVTRWGNGTKPRRATLQKIADYFGVTVEELIRENKKTTTENSGGFSEKDIRLVAWFNSLPEEKQKAILSLGGSPEDLAE